VENIASGLEIQNVLVDEHGRPRVTPFGLWEIAEAKDEEQKFFALPRKSYSRKMKISL
jgi:hypothetical protein